MTQTDLNKQDQTSANAQGPDPIDPPLPALTPGMQLARPEHFQFEGSPGADTLGERIKTAIHGNDDLEVKALRVLPHLGYSIKSGGLFGRTKRVDYTGT
jgi:hypothetical protein